MARDSYGAQEYELGVRNVAGLVANFYAFDEEVQTQIRDAVREFGLDTQDLTVMLAPKDTGFMSEHVLLRFTPSALGYEVGWDASDFYEAGLAFYPYFQEFGTRHMRAQPSVGPAHETTAPLLQERISEILRQSAARRSSNGAG